MPASSWRISHIFEDVDPALNDRTPAIWPRRVAISRSCRQSAGPGGCGRRLRPDIGGGPLESRQLVIEMP
jgi:hypothetical protein